MVPTVSSASTGVVSLGSTLQPSTRAATKTRRNIDIVRSQLKGDLKSLVYRQSYYLTDKITSYGEEYSIAIRVLETTDKVTFFSKEKRSIDKGGGYSHKKSVWPNITFN